MEDKLKKSVLVAALLFSAFSCVTVMAAENIPANSQIFKEAKSLPKIPANPKVFTGKAEVIQMSQQVPGMPVQNGIVKEEPEFMEKKLVLLNPVTLSFVQPELSISTELVLILRWFR